MRKLFVPTKEKTKAQAMVEFALVLPILLLLIYGMMEVGRLLFIYASTITAARQAARYGAATGKAPGTNVPYYQHCPGIESSARQLGFLTNFQEVNVGYDGGLNVSGAPVNVIDRVTLLPAPPNDNHNFPPSLINPATATCGTFVTAENGDRITVEVSALWTPITPLVPLSPFMITSKSSRTILVSVDIAVTGVPAPWGGTGGIPELTVVASPTTYNVAGQVITFTFTIKNIGSTSLTGIPAISPLPGVTLNPSCDALTTATLAPTATFVCTGTYPVTQDDLDIGKADKLFSSPTTFLVPLTAIQKDELTMTKDSNVPSSVTNVTYTYTLKNTGNVTLSGSGQSVYIITDDKLGTICQGGGQSRFNADGSVASGSTVLPLQLAPNASIICKKTHTVTNQEIADTQIVNLATATAKYINISTGLQTVTTTATKTVKTTPIFLNIVGENIAGLSPFTSEQIKYTFTVQNNGASPVTLAGIVVGPFSGHGVQPTVTCSGSIGAGATMTCPIVYYNVVQADLDNVNPSTGVKIPVTITATATAGVYTSTMSLYSVDLFTKPELTLTAATTIPPSATSPAVTTTVGSVVTYTYTITNTGNVTMYPPVGGFVVTDTQITNSITCNTPTVAIAPGGTKICTSTREILAEDVTNGSVIGTVATSGLFGVTSYAPATVVKSVTVTSTVPRLTLEITTPVSSVVGAGVTITYSYILTNTGNADLTAVLDSTPYDFVTGSLKGTVPTCTDGTLAIGESTTCTGTYVTQSSDKGTDVTNTTSAYAYTVVGNLQVHSLNATAVVAVLAPTFCSVSHGALVTTVDGVTTIGMTITNNNEYSIDVSSITIDYNDTPNNQQITELTLGTGNVLWQKSNQSMNGNYTFTTGMYTGNYTLAPGASNVMFFVSGWKTGYTPNGSEHIAVTFSDASCPVLDSGVPSVIPNADMQITKTDGVATVDTNSTITYTITVTNSATSTSSITNAKLSDPVASGLTKLTIACAGGLCVTPPTKTQLESGSFVLPTFAIGDTYTITVTAKVTASAGATVTNSATVTSPLGTTDPIPGNNTATDADAVANPAADMTITKDDGSPTAAAGASIIYTVHITNNGPSTIAGALLTDPAATGLTKTSVSCSGTPGQCITAPTLDQLESGYALPTIASGQSYEILVNADVTAASGGSITNTATLTMPTGTSDPTPGNNSASDTDTITSAIADMAITKTNGVSAVAAGTSTTYTIRATNNGPSAATGAILSDPAATGLTKTSVVCSSTAPGQCAAAPTIAQLESGTFALPLLASGQFYEITVVTDVTAASGSVSNTATIAVPAGTTDPTPGNDSATDTDPITVIADLAITKNDGFTAVDSGGQTNYTIRVTNNGPSTVTGAILTDAAVTGLTKTAVVCSGTPGQCGAAPSVAPLESGTFALPTLTSGQFYEITVTATVTATSGSVSNVATVSSALADPTPGNNSATDTDTVDLSADMAISKTNGVASVVAGGSTTYTIRVTNLGPSTATGAVLTDPAVTGLNKTAVACSGTPGQCASAPAVGTLQVGGVTLPALASGQYYEITVTASVTAVSGNVSNIASVAAPAGMTDPFAGNNSATDTDSVSPGSDLAITKTDSATALNAGGVTIYTIRVTNNGPSSATGALLTDPAATGLTKTAVACSTTPGQCVTAPTITQLQSGGYPMPALNSGQFFEFTVTANVTALSGTVTNVATVAAPVGVTDPTPANNTASDIDTVSQTCSAGTLTLTNPASLVGTTLTWTINNGTGATLRLTNVSVSWSLTNGQKDLDSIQLPTGTNIWTGSSTTQPTSASGSWVVNTGPNTLTLAFGSQSVTVSNLTLTFQESGCPTLSNVVVPTADLGITKTNSAASVNAGGTTTYTIRVTNNGPSDVSGAILTDIAATGLSKNSVACSGTPGQCATPPSVAQLQAGTFALPALTAGQFYEITVPTTVSASSGSVTNVATIDTPAGSQDLTPGNDSATDTDTINLVSDLAVTKTDGVITIGGNANTTYTIRVTNNGPSSVTGAILSDVAATGLSKTSVACSGTPGQCASAPSVAQLEGGTFALPVMTSGQFYEISVLTNVTAISGSVANVATVAAPAGTTDGTPANNSATDTDTVTAPSADLAITKTDSVASVGVGANTTYTIRVTNNGPAAVTGAILSDVAATGLSKTSVACSGTPGQCSAPPTVAQLQAGTFALPALTSGQFYEITVLTGVTAVSGNVSNVATVATPAGTTDPTPANNSATDTNSVTPAADLSITKTDSVAAVNTGANTTYTIRVTNGGPSPVTGAILTDPTATGLSKTSAACSATPGQCSVAPTVAALQGVGVTLPALASGQFYEITILTNVTATNGSVANVANIAAPAGATDPALANNSATDTDTINPSSDLAITKTDGVASINSGANTTYTIRVTNNGPSSVTGAILGDVAATGLSKTSVSCSGTPGQCATPPTVAQLEAGTFALPALNSTQFYEISVVTNVTAVSGNVTNVATVAAPAGTTDGTPANNSATDTDSVISPSADLAITKTDGVASAASGSTTTYTIRVTNNGPSSATGAILSDVAATGLSKTSVSCSGTPGQCSAPPSVAQLEGGAFALPAITSGQFYEINVLTSVTATSGNVVNIATVAAPVGITDGTPGNNSATDTDSVTLSADLSITKTDSVASIDTGANTTYTIRVTNGGPSAVTGAILSDVAATGLSKTSVACSGTPGQCSAAPSVAQLQAGTFALPALTSGQFYEITVLTNVSATSGSVTNTATIAAPAGATDPAAGNNSAADTDTVNKLANLAITKTDGVASISSGNSTSYTITVTNAGPSAGDGAIFTDPSISGLSVTSVTCAITGTAVCPASSTVAAMQGAGLTIPTLPSGASSVIFTVAGSVTATSGSIANVANIAAAAGTTDPTPGNNSITDSDTVTLSADLGITKTDSVLSVNSGANTTYTIRVTNGGPSAVTGAILGDVAATGLSKTSVACSGTPGQCLTPPTVAELQAGTFALPALASGQFYEITVLTNVSAASGSVSNVATIAAPAGASDPAAGNNSATDTNTVIAVTDLAITKTNGFSSMNAGGSFNYTIVVTNNGPIAANGAIFTDPAVTGITVASVTCGTPLNGAVCPTSTVVLMQGAGIVIATLPNTGSVTFTVTASFLATNAALPTSLTNTASIAVPAGIADSDISNNSIAHTDTANSACNGITLLTAPAPLSGALVYTWTINNSTAIPLTLTNISTTFTSGSPAGKLSTVEMPAGTVISSPASFTPVNVSGSWTVNASSSPQFKLTFSKTVTVTDLTLTFAQTGCSVSNP